MMITLGSTEICGMPVRPVALGGVAGRQLLGEQPYRYESVRLTAGETLHLEGKTRYCAYVIAADTPVRINDFVVPVDSYVLGESDVLDITATAGSAQVLLASQAVEQCRNPLQKIDVQQAKKVDKPWGHEIWLTGDPSPVFAFKRILLKAGNRTSLQYHRYKRETNFIVAGQAHLHYNPQQEVVADAVTPDMIAHVPLNAPVVVDVFPGLVHRLEALTDLTLFEVSTPELDDVIRIHDETGRAHGRIHQEHS